MPCLTDGLLKIALPGLFARQQHDDGVRAVGGERLHVARLHAGDGTTELGRQPVECRRGNEAQVASPRGRLRIFGIVHRDGAEIRTGLQPLAEHLRLPQRLLRCGRVVAHAIGNLRLGHRRHHDLRETELGFRQVELRPVLLEGTRSRPGRSAWPST